MFEKAQNLSCKLIVKANMELYNLIYDEDGDGEVSKMVYIGIAVLGAFIMMNLLFGDNRDGKGGIIGKIYKEIIGKIDKLFK